MIEIEARAVCELLVISDSLIETCICNTGNYPKRPQVPDSRNYKFHLSDLSIGIYQ